MSDVRDWWVSPEKLAGGNLRIIPIEGGDPIAFLLKHPLMFGLQPDDIKLAQEPSKTVRERVDKIAAFLDRQFHLGWLWVHFDSERTPRLSVKFDVESGPVGRQRMHTIAQLLKQEGIGEQELVHLQAQERQSPDGTGWATTAGAVMREHMLWTNEDKPPCPHCGKPQNKDELLEVGVCPWCKKPIA